MKQKAPVIVVSVSGGVVQNVYLDSGELKEAIVVEVRDHDINPGDYNQDLEYYTDAYCL